MLVLFIKAMHHLKIPFKAVLFSGLLMLVQSAVQGQTVKAPGIGTEAKIITIVDYERLIKYYRYYKQDSAIYFFKKGIEFARNHSDSNGVALMLIQLGMIEDNQGEFENSKKNYELALNIFTTIQSKVGIATTRIRLGVVEIRNGKYDNAIRYFLQALKLSEEADDKFGMMEANYSISWAYLDQRNYISALKYLQIAEKFNDSLPFSNLSLNIFNHLGVVYRETGDYKRARNYLEKGVRSSNEPQYQGLNITLINNLASVYSKTGLKARAIAIQKEALKRSREIGNYLRELQVLYGLSRTYGTEQPLEAVHYLQTAINLAKSKGAYNQEMRYLKAISPLLIKQGNYKQAYLMKEREKALADSFLYKTMSQNIASLKAEYELSKSNTRIKQLDLLNKQKQIELKNASVIRKTTYGGIALLLVIVALLINQNLVKKKNNARINSKNKELQHLLDEKDWLLKEVHHRVKNNLQTIMSLLETQSAYLKDDALLAIQNSQHRVYAMSLIHQRLYKFENSTGIDMAVSLAELIDYLSDSYAAKQRILFRMNIDHIQLDISQAIPIGLIVNEAITNAIKYAFPGSGTGEIYISMKQKNKTIRLLVKDNGIGLSKSASSFMKGTLGMKLMKGLTEDIRGEFIIESNEGTCILIEFPHDQLFIKKSKPHRELIDSPL